MKHKFALGALAALSSLLMLGCSVQAQNTDKQPQEKTTTQTKVTKTEEEWKRTLTPTQYHVLREKGTERAFTGKYWDNHQAGTYLCAGCGKPLFASQNKFESGTGWPSFWQPLTKEAIEEHEDSAYGMVRTEVVCKNCGGHLGHVFDDGPKPTGLRYCINSVSLQFKKASPPPPKAKAKQNQKPKP
jgi:peptide-methionine (R)-S-oxide reductase